VIICRQGPPLVRVRVRGSLFRTCTWRTLYERCRLGEKKRQYVRTVSSPIQYSYGQRPFEGREETSDKTNEGKGLTNCGRNERPCCAKATLTEWTLHIRKRAVKRSHCLFSRGCLFVPLARLCLFVFRSLSHMGPSYCLFSYSTNLALIATP
jgi:hypothetical protein